MSKKELLAYLLEHNTNISIWEIVIGMCVAALLAMIVYVVYKKTYSGVMYSKNFNITLVVICLITTMVIMIIGSNLALSLGMVGALSIIRFRTAVKEPKDSAYIFWVIAIGIACGTGIYSIAFLGCGFISAILLIFKHGTSDDNSYLLIIHANSNVDRDLLGTIVSSYTQKNRLKMQNETPEKIDFTFEVKLKQEAKEKLMTDITKVEKVFAVNLVEYNGEIAG